MDAVEKANIERQKRWCVSCPRSFRDILNVHLSGLRIKRSARVLTLLSIRVSTLDIGIFTAEAHICIHHRARGRHWQKSRYQENQGRPVQGWTGHVSNT
jgi:hypothetical protein